MFVIGITGGVASGKSLVSAELARLGAGVIDADGLAKVVLATPGVIDIARQRWGDAVVDGDGQLCRAAVAQRVFGGAPAAAEELAFWESVTHPRITERMLAQLRHWQAEARLPAVIIDAPVMFKAGWDRHCDKLIFVESPYEQRLDRAKARGWTEAELKDRERSQLPIEEKRRRATTVIDNSGTLEDTYEQVRKYWQALSH